MDKEEKSEQWYKKSKCKKENVNHKDARSFHYKKDKARDVRKIADRHSHHRRRKMVKENLAKGNIVSSSDTPHSFSSGNNHTHGAGFHDAKSFTCSNRKAMFGTKGMEI